ncbi:MAG TPA: PAS domain-containing protein, partial [Ramlibacter sp.]|nr:PAS domain-containing protein [Ramlibacter sp.]
MALLMDELAHGVLIVDPAGKLLHANQAARHELARRRVVVGSAGLGQALNAQDARCLQDALAKVAAGKRSLVTLHPGEGIPLSLAVLPLGSGRAGGSAALVFSRPAVCESLMLCFFARSHGLTSTEEHVLGILCQGYSAPQVAAQMDV